jgi:hypothetical protein
MKPLLLSVATLSGLLSPLAAQTVYVSRFWHNHQPLYWPEWNTNGAQTNRVEYAQDSIVLKSGRSYPGSTSQHPDNNLTDIFGLDDRRNAYQFRPKDALAACPTAAGFVLSYSGSLIDNVRSLAAAGNLGYGATWADGNRTAKGWATPSGSRRLDLVGFTYHHSLAPLLPKEVFRKELQIFKQAWWKAWNGAANGSDHSKGFFPTEMAFSTSLVDVLVEEGYQWSIVASHHLSRTCPTYFNQFNLAGGNYGIFSSPPNRADSLGPSPTAGWWYSQPNPGNAAWNVAPFAYQLQKAKWVNPSTGVEKTLVVVPSDDVLSYRYGYANEGISKIQSSIAPHATSTTRPVIVMPSTDGDNAWGGGYSSWMEATPQFFSSSQSSGYQPTAPQDFVNAHAAAAPVVHVEDGAWIFPESDYGSPYFLKWIEPPVAATAATRYPGTVVDMETPGFALKFWAWAPVITGANWVETAEQILEDEGGTVQAWKIQAPTDWNGTNSNPNEVEQAWHVYLGGLDSGFNYYGGLGNDDEVKAALATKRAVEKLQPWMTAARLTNDRTAPSVLKPQRFPYNPGGYTFGWFNSIAGGNTNYLKKMASDFYVWTHAYDVSGITTLQLKVRVDADGTNSLASNHNETYAGGSDVGTWTSLGMTKRLLPNTQAALNAAASNGQINYFITPPVLADYYFAKINETALPGYKGKLLDYYVEATDSRGNVHQSEIQHVFVENDNAATTAPAVPTGLAVTTATSTSLSLDWADTPTAADYLVFRNGTQVATTATSSYTDSGLTPSTSYQYTVAARNAAGTSAASSSFTGTTSATVVSTAFVMDGTADHAGYLLSNPGMTIYAALRGTKLYVATWAPGSFANDHFILVGTSVLASATAAAPWGKTGTTALPPGSPFLAAESSNNFIGWTNAGTAAVTTARAAGQQMEGTIDLGTTLPTDLYVAALAYQTADAGTLGSQAPAAVTANGNVEPTEFFRIPLEALRDEDANGTWDRLEMNKPGVLTQLAQQNSSLQLTWKCFPGKSYRIEASTSLSSGSWAAVGPNVVAGSTALTASANVTLAVTEPRKFYRVVLLP